MEKFIILSHPRTGSTFLRNVLNQFDGVECDPELFNPYILKSNPEISKFPVEYLKKLYVSGGTGKGFKLQYNQALKDNLTQIWPYLIGEEDIKIIRLIRINKLKLLISLRKAQQVSEWNKFSELNRKKNKITLDITYQKCLYEFKRFTRVENEYHEKFKKHPMLTITYEDLIQDYYKTIDSVKSFLNIDAPTPKSEVKVKKLKLSDELTNYQQLKDKFKGSKWESFFEY